MSQLSSDEVEYRTNFWNFRIDDDGNCSFFNCTDRSLGTEPKVSTIIGTMKIFLHFRTLMIVIFKSIYFVCFSTAF